MIAECQCIYQIFDAVPVIDTTDFCFRGSVAVQLENCWENTMLIQFT